MIYLVAESTSDTPDTFISTLKGRNDTCNKLRQPELSSNRGRSMILQMPFRRISRSRDGEGDIETF